MFSPAVPYFAGANGLSIYSGSPKNLALVERLRKVGQKYRRPPGQVAVVWVLHNPAVTAAIVGARSAQQVEQNVGAAELDLTDDDIAGDRRRQRARTKIGNGSMKGIMNSPQIPLLPVLAFALLATMTETKAKQPSGSEDETYLSPSASVPTGKAPGMKVQLLAENGGMKNYAIVLAKGDEVMSGLTDFARQNKVTAASFTAIGAFSHATVAWFDKSKKEFKLIPIKQQVELVSMIGDIALSGDQPAVHTHVSVASSDGTLRGGHLIDAYVFPTLELFITVYPTPLHKQLDEATGLKLIDPSSK